jgi:hypothetical protein
LILRPLDPPVLLLDEGLGQHDVAEALRAAGARVEIHAAHFKPGELDETWISEAARRGWVVLSKDSRMRYRQPIQRAVRRASARVFVLKSSGKLKGPEMGAIFAEALTAIYNTADREPPPFIAKVGKAGRVEVWWPERPKKSHK